MVEALERAFPGLASSSWRITSPATGDYNCIAWAAGDTTRWWWPSDDPEAPAFWPEGVPATLTLSAFLALFATLGYVQTADEKAEPGLDKVALYIREDDTPTHAARQLPTGEWSSKLGRSIDIEHALHALSGTIYGRVVCILQRPAAS
jgi:hypothetical protein